MLNIVTVSLGVPVTVWVTKAVVPQPSILVVPSYMVVMLVLLASASINTVTVSFSTPPTMTTVQVPIVVAMVVKGMVVI